MSFRGRKIGTGWRNLLLRLGAALRGMPLPSDALVEKVTGGRDLLWFDKGGQWGLDSMVEILAKDGVDCASLGAILDFGCGVGRVLRHWRLPPSVEIHGTDYNPNLVDWCRAHLPHARFHLNALDPPLDFPDERFDLVYALSVFTHLPEAGQHAWMAELTRVLRPGGYMLISLHGRAYLDQLSSSERSAFEAGEMVVWHAEEAGRNACAAYHPEPWVRERMSEGLELIDCAPEGARGNPRQDLYLFRKSVR